MKKFDWNLEKIKIIVPQCVNFTEVLNALNIPRQGNNSKTLRALLDKNNIDYSHFTGRARIYSKEVIPIEEYLSNKRSTKSSELKERLIKLSFKENKCECCGLTSWNGKPIVMQLHHIDGNHLNNSLDNLQILCPNCHSQTENFCGNANKNKKISKKYYCPDCGKEITKNSTYCPVCASRHSRKVERPDKEILFNLLVEYKNFTKVGKLYKVCDNTIRKWCKQYNLSTTISDYK